MAKSQQETVLDIAVFGGVCITAPDGTYLEISSRKAVAMLCYLALSDHGVESREKIAGLFWSDSAEEQARASLRQCTKLLNTVFNRIGFVGFNATRTDLRLDRSVVRLDLVSLVQDLGDRRIPMTLIDGSAAPEQILYGFEGLDHAFDAWLRVFRQRLQENFMTKLEVVLRDIGTQPETHQACAMALVRLDPTDEEAQQHLIRHYASHGNIAAAIAQYDSLWELLDVHYDMEPSSETALLIADVKLGEDTNSAAPPAPHGAVASIDRLDGDIAAVQIPNQIHQTQLPVRLPVIGISVFVQGGLWTGDPNLIEAFRRDLISSIVRFREWMIVEAGAMSYLEKGAQKNGLDFILEGAFFQEGEQHFVSITLKDTATLQFIWSEKINLAAEYWQDAQRKIIRSMSTSLSIHISARRISNAVETTDVSYDIYSGWVKGQSLLYSWSLPAFEQASEIFRNIIDKAPAFAPAYSSLSQILNSVHILCPGVYRDPERTARSVDFAKIAVELDPLDSRSLLCLGWAYAMSGRFNQSVLHHRMARDLNACDLWTNLSASQGLAFAGEIDQAQEFTSRITRVMPMLTPYQWAYIAKIRFLNADYEGSAQALENIEEFVPYALGWKAAALIHLGHDKEAAEAYRRFIDLIGAAWIYRHPLDDQSIRAWFLQCFPISDQTAVERLRLGLSAAHNVATQLS